jgi:hypothetical protein
MRRTMVTQGKTHLDPSATTRGGAEASAVLGWRPVAADIGAEQARLLVQAVASELQIDPTTLDHAIWSHQRRRRE